MLLCHAKYFGNLSFIGWFVDGLVVGYNSLGCAISAQFVFVVLLCRTYIAVCSTHILWFLWEISEVFDRQNRFRKKKCPMQCHLRQTDNCGLVLYPYWLER